MPRFPLALAAATAALALGLGLGLGASGASAADQPTALAPPPAPAAVDWRLAEAGGDARSLDLTAFGSSSCLPGTVSTTVRETARRIEIAVVSTPVTADQVCTADYAPLALTVRLAAPVRGRAVVGPRRLRRDPFAGRPPGRAPLRVPRLTGLAPSDALAVAREHGLRPAVERVADLRDRPRVIGQTPASGRGLRPGATVTLFISR